ncbi:MAG: hypothetical protein JW700_03920 [Candidatus Aenigmarchaeota archaeon]|nr:hypothetical protein [Candidatus Aenigmarchaeota archaeon]
MRKALVIVPILFVFFMLLSVSPIFGPNLSNPSHVSAFIIFIIMIFGMTLSITSSSRVMRITNEKMGYGPYLRLNNWPSKFYERNKDSTVNLLRIKEDFKPKVESWKEEYNRTLMTDKVFVFGIVLTIISVVLILYDMTRIFNV